LGLLPDTTFSVENDENGFIEIVVEGKKVKLPKALAEQVNVRVG